MTLAELVAPLPAPPEAGRLEIAGLAADSRQVQPGYLFAAIPGVTQDGAAFAAQAVAAGAVAILAQDGAGPMPAPVVRAPDVRLALSRAAARFWPGQPEVVAAITGTNGKSSTVEFLRQIWAEAGRKAAAIGTLGVRTDAGVTALAHTTPDPIGVHRTLDALARDGITHAAMEASSHGLDQRRLDSVRIRVAGFTNLSRDHFDYHGDFENYFAAKKRLFDELLSAEDGVAVIVTDDEWGARMAVEARGAGRSVHTVGRAGDFIRIDRTEPLPEGQRLFLRGAGGAHCVTLPLIGAFQAQNAVLAAGMAIAGGEEAGTVIAALAHLQGARGRMETVGRTPSGAAVYVDYAHTPDGLAQALAAVRPHAQGRVHVVFGAGGDRDPGKRAPMGAAAVAAADHVTVTDDNPRNEDPAAIRAEILRGAPQAQEIGDRRDAIYAAVRALRAGDILLIAGKGHETGQIQDGKTRPFDDAEVARAALADFGGGARE